MKINQTKIDGVFEVLRDPIIDDRGLFERVFCNDSLDEYIGRNKLMQINHSISVNKGAIRGMHLQLGECAEIKIVTCFVGAVFDIALDLRRNSNTFLQWVSINLSPKNNNSFIIPKGVAHGFQTLTNKSELLYLHTENYSPEHELGVNYRDPKFQIKWPIPVTQISDRDKSFALLDNNFSGFDL